MALSVLRRGFQNYSILEKIFIHSIERFDMNSKLAAMKGLRASRSRGVKIALAGLFFVTLLGFVVGALSTGEGSVGDTVTTSLLWLYIGTSVALPLFILAQVGYAISNRIRGVSQKTDQSTQNTAVSFVIRAVEVVLAVVILLVEGSLGYLFLTQPGGEGAGAIVIGVGLLITLLGSCLAVTALADGIIGYTRSETSSTA